MGLKQVLKEALSLAENIESSVKELNENNGLLRAEIESLVRDVSLLEDSVMTLQTDLSDALNSQL